MKQFLCHYNSTGCLLASLLTETEAEILEAFRVQILPILEVGDTIKLELEE